MEKLRHKFGTFKRGFTLAEVLITLVIVGIIAAITIPTVVNNTKKQEYVAGLKKAYSTFVQVTNKIIADEGNPRGDIGGWATSAEDIYNLYKKYLVNTKECGGNEGCFEQAANITYLNGNIYPYGTWDTSSDVRKMILSDGTQVLFDFASNDCQATYGRNNDYVCAGIWVDLNGEKKPNRIGRDIFTFLLRENGLYPRGCDDDSDCVIDRAGHNCACKVLRENAMNY